MSSFTPGSDRHVDAAATTDLSSVYIFNTWEREPRYHDYGRIKQLDIARTGDVTKCGLVMYDGETHYRALLRRDHADLFARPCAKCFPEEYDHA